jgi:hypothetical protein
MKVCRECQIEKPLSYFYKHAKMADGHLNKCIVCVKARVGKYREANLERVREYDKKRSNQPHRVIARKEYVKTEEGKQTKKKAMDAYKKRFPMVYASHVITGNAIRNGKLIQASNCSICNSTEKIEGHHDDYTRPLKVRWLCESCHKEWHRNNKPIYE